ncbi:hypothetical protein [Microbulbifer mangrovi]|uniref:hypothetical protein n=1 Tax=Microbulbifer mangrovi TaxID=927787 RepID=UPI00117DD763|nr:hypothetical protein [Microbulbifer mangrovi]
MSNRQFSRHAALGKTLCIGLATITLLWPATQSLARPGFGGGHFSGPRMNIHPGFAGGMGLRPKGPIQPMHPVRPDRPMGGDIHRVPPYHGPRPEHRPPHEGGGDHRGGDDKHHDHHHGHYWPYPAPGYWAGMATGAAVGAMVYSLPSECVEREVNGVAYEECSGTWYRPSYAGTQVVYEVVPTP